MPKKINIPKEIKAKRTKLGLSQTAFAKLCGLSQPVMREMEIEGKELCEHVPRIPTLRKIAAAIGEKLVFGNSQGKIFSKNGK